MGSTVGTQLTPYQALQALIGPLGDLQAALSTQMKLVDPGAKVRASERVVHEAHMIPEIMDKFNDSFFLEMNRYAQKLAQSAKVDTEHIKEIEAALKDIDQMFLHLRVIYHDHVRRAHYFYQLCHNLARITEKMSRGVQRLEKQNLRMMKKHFTQEQKRDLKKANVKKLSRNIKKKK